MSEAPFIHPYIPNSVPAVREEMLREIGLQSVEDILAEIPAELRVPGLLDLPEPLLSEYDLRRHVQGLLDRNVSTAEYLSFLGGGCAPHFVPALCDEIVARGEFLTAYSGCNYSDLGKHQARFEYNSLMAELLDYDVVVEPAYDWGSAAGFAAPHGEPPDRPPRDCCSPRTSAASGAPSSPSSASREYMAGHIAIDEVACDRGRPAGPRRSGSQAVRLDRRRLLREPRLPRPARAGRGRDLPAGAGRRGASPSPASIRSVWASSRRRAPTGPTSPSVTCSRWASTWRPAPASPASWPSATRRPTCASVRSPSTRSSRRRCPESTPSLSCSAGAPPTGCATRPRTSWAPRPVCGPSARPSTWRAWGRGACARWGRRSCGGPTMPPAAWLPCRASACRSGRASSRSSPSASTAPAGASAEVNEALLARGIFGGRDLSADYPQLGQSALYCVTEVHTKADIDRLADGAGGGALMNAIGGEQGGVRDEEVAGRMAEKLERNARLRREGGLLRDYHAAHWDEPLVMELGRPGERGVIPPQAADVAGEVPEAAQLLPRGAAPPRPAGPAGGQPAAAAAPLHAALPDVPRRRRDRRHRRGHLHDEVLAQGQRAARPLSQAQRAAPRPAGGDAAGYPRDLPPHGRHPLPDQRPG